jgi:hypothetical protein
MKLTHDELEFLSAWAREEWEPACYELPAHHLQLAHGVAGAQLIVFIKAGTDGEGKKDQEILAAAVNPQPHWPWSTAEDFAGRLAEASGRRTHREGTNVCMARNQAPTGGLSGPDVHQSTTEPSSAS